MQDFYYILQCKVIAVELIYNLGEGHTSWRDIAQKNPD